MASSGEAASESSLDSSGLASSSSGSSSAQSVLSILDQLKSPQPSEIEASVCASRWHTQKQCSSELYQEHNRRIIGI